MASLTAIEDTVLQALDQLPRDYSAGLCHEDAGTALRRKIDMIREVADILSELLPYVEEE